MMGIARGLGRAWRLWRRASFVATLALSAPIVLPAASEAMRVWRAWNAPLTMVEDRLTDDEEALAEWHLETLTAADYERAIREALDAGDADLAAGLVDLAEARGLTVAPGLAEAAARATADASVARNIWNGVRGEPDTLEGLAASVVTDFTTVGDLRDLWREYDAMPDHDPVVVTLAAAGLAATAGTIVTSGGGAPVKVGLSVLKVAKKAGKLNARLMARLSRQAARAVDTSALREAVQRGARADLKGASRAAARAVDRQVIQEISGTAGVVGRMAGDLGPKAALDTLARAESAADVARLGKLAAKQRSTYRATLRLVPDVFRTTRVVTRTLGFAYDFVTDILGWIVAGALWIVSAALALLRLSWKAGRLGLRGARAIARRAARPTSAAGVACPNPAQHG